MLRLAINGYGRIGRSVLRALYESAHRQHMQVIAINEPADLNTIAHLSKYDTTHGRFPGTVAIEQERLCINGDAIAISHHSDLTDLPWRELNIDVVLECSGRYDTQRQLDGHLRAGARRVLLSQPGTTEIPAIVYGINQSTLSGTENIISAASCSTNCIVPVIKILDDAFGLEHGIITTIHSAMNDQPVLDAYHHTDLRKTRAAGQSIIPVETGLAAGVGRILPALAERFAAHALRVPTINVSAMQLTMQLSTRHGHAATVASASSATLKNRWHRATLTTIHVPVWSTPAKRASSAS
jgi:glyceraldehyde 3-phosphate dehydrogenase/D-erythrose 4-phosphate dehydrogenase